MSQCFVLQQCNTYIMILLPIHSKRAAIQSQHPIKGQGSRDTQTATEIPDVLRLEGRRISSTTSSASQPHGLAKHLKHCVHGAYSSFVQCLDKPRNLPPTYVVWACSYRSCEYSPYNHRKHHSWARSNVKQIQDHSERMETMVSKKQIRRLPRNKSKL